MIPAHLHQGLIQACENEDLEDVKQWLDQGADVNYNINTPINALGTAVRKKNDQIIDLLLAHGAIVKALVLQRAIETDKAYLHRLMPDVRACRDETLLMGILQAAITIGDVDLAKQAIAQGAKPASLLLSSIGGAISVEMLTLLIENGFNIHADDNMLLSDWMGSSRSGPWWDRRPQRDDLLAFIAGYYLHKPESMEGFGSLYPPYKSLLFRLGLDNSDMTVMRFALQIGANENEALNSALHRYYANKQEHAEGRAVNLEIIEYILDLKIRFDRISITNAVCFNYSELLDALVCMDDLEYAYEMAYTYNKEEWCDYFAQRGVSEEAQRFTRMKVSSVKGDMKALAQAVNEGADIQALKIDTIVEIIHANRVESLQYLYEAGYVLDTSLEACLDEAMNYHKAYESVTFLIECGVSISRLKNIPFEYKRQYPAIADMWSKGMWDIFEYTLYLSRDLYPTREGKEKEETLERIAQLSTLPYVKKRSEEMSMSSVKGLR